jgi:hypothetical protein
MNELVNYQSPFVTPHLGLYDVGVRHRLKDQFTVSDRKLDSATGAREFPILGVAGSNATCCSVLNE